MEIKEFSMCDNCDITEDLTEAGEPCGNCGNGELQPVVGVVCADRDEAEKVKITVEAALGITG